MTINMPCPICNSNETKLIYVNMEGYVAKTYFNIYSCLDCFTQFINPDKEDKSIYEKIYGQNTYGYSRYMDYVESIKKQLKPLEWLANKEPAYLFIKNYLDSLQEKKLLRILEVGCGNGYLTYAINKEGHYANGIDISSNAIKVAREVFGEFYESIDLINFFPINKFDLIISTETIEHIKDPNLFIKNCLRLLNPTGEIILTTANKDFRSPNTTWQTELPPVHRFWFGHKSFIQIAKNLNLEINFPKLKMPIDFDRNLYVAFLTSRGNKVFPPTFNKNGKSKETEHNSILRRFAMWYPVKWTCNYIYNLMLNTQPPTLCIILKKPLSH